jgi:hypothetical protein
VAATTSGAQSLKAMKPRLIALFSGASLPLTQARGLAGISFIANHLSTKKGAVSGRLQGRMTTPLSFKYSVALIPSLAWVPMNASGARHMPSPLFCAGASRASS